jgi:hypothetical protein
MSLSDPLAIVTGLIGGAMIQVGGYDYSIVSGAWLGNIVA